MTTIEILKKARELLSDPARWTKGAYARDAAGASTSEHEPEAICFCSLGALYSFGAPASAVQALRATLPCNVVAYNDAPERTHTEVLQRFDEAIARLEAAG